MSAELVETTRLWARVNAKIEPEWVEPLAEHLLKRTYSEPHWEKDQAAVMAYEKVTLYGVPIVAQRKVNYGRIDAELSRSCSSATPWWRATGARTTSSSRTTASC